MSDYCNECGKPLLVFPYNGKCHDCFFKLEKSSDIQFKIMDEKLDKILKLMQKGAQD